MKSTILVSCEWRATAEQPSPDVSFVPAMMRRRLTGLERAALAVAGQALARYREQGGDACALPVVFASRWGEIGTTLKLMQQMFAEGEMSPAGFANSVHNAAPGHLSLVTKNQESYTAIAAGEKTYEMGLLEAQTTPGRVLFVYAEEETPALYRPHFPSPQTARAAALILENTHETERCH